MRENHGMIIEVEEEEVVVAEAVAEGEYFTLLDFLT